MRRLILKMSISLDGFVASPGGEIDWIFRSPGEDVTAWTLRFIAKAGAHLMGSRTFHDMAAHWPTSSEPFAAPMNEIPKVVFSRKGLLGPYPGGVTGALSDALAMRPIDAAAKARGADSWIHPTVVSGDLAQEIAKLKAQPGGDLIAYGGAGLAGSLAAAGLVDEYALLVHPVALGHGLPLFASLERPAVLTLVRSTPFAGGAVAQVYRPASSSA
jgi:dihydrofolate reductase